jgi:hypothetical protein
MLTSSMSLKGRENAECPGWRLRCRACRTTDKRGLPALHDRSAAPSADRKDIPHDQHPDHQFRIDRWTTHQRIMRCKFAAKPGKIESSVDLPHQGDPREPRRQDETRRTADLGQSSDGPLWLARDWRQHNGIMLRGLSQPTFATWGNSGIEPDKRQGNQLSRNV